MLTKRFCLLAVTFISVHALSSAALKPSDVKVAREGDTTYFRIELTLPEDASGQKVALPFTVGTFSPARAFGGTRFPVLVSDPPYASPCYMWIVRQNEWDPGMTSNAFYGKTHEKNGLTLKLIYPKKSSGWGSEDVEIKFDGASTLAPQTLANVRATSGTQLSAAQQFAYAQSNGFRLLRAQIDDDAGFLGYAQAQTLRMAHLPADTVSNPFVSGMPDVVGDHLYDTATGARAIQESLQIDRMVRGGAANSESRTIDVASIQGVQTKSHPFAEMLKGKTPVFSPIAKMIPADQYMLRFTSVAKLQQLADFAQQWGHSLLESPEVGGADAGLRARLQKQICLPATLLSRVLGPMIVKEIAVTGSDPYFREGTDVTVIFDTASPDLFKAAVDQYWKAALAENPSADTKPITSGTTVEKIVTPDRSVSAYRAFLGSTVVYSNSLPALQRIIDTRSNPASSLASAEDFQYMRAVWPQDEKSEDGFLYLSDAFIRHLVGPALKIKEKRRLEAYGTMRLVMNAAMFHGYLNGPGKTPSIDELVEKGELTKSDVRMPDGDLKWDPATVTASSTVFGTPTFLTPLCELPIDKVSSSESQGYATFRDRYQEYWRRYFDPIGIRIKVDKTISLDAYILPLIDESNYNDLKRLTGDKPAKFDLAKISTGTLLRWQVRLDPEAKEIRDARQMLGGMFGKDKALTDWIGNWATFWLEDAAATVSTFGDMFGSEFENEEDDQMVGPGRTMTSFFDVPLAGGIDVKNKLSLAAFLVSVQGMVNTAAPNLVRFVPQEPYKGVTFVKIAPAPGGEIERELKRESARADESTGAATARADKATTVPDIGLYYGSIGDAWYISTKQFVLEHLVDSQDAVSSPSREIEYNAFFVASPANAKESRKGVAKATAILTRQAERDKLSQAWLLYRCNLISPTDGITTASPTWFGGEITLPSGGTISYDAAGCETVSSVLGPMRQLKRGGVLMSPDANPLLRLFDSIDAVRAWLRFTEDGLVTHVELERN